MNFQVMILYLGFVVRITSYDQTLILGLIYLDTSRGHLRPPGWKVTNHTMVGISALYTGYEQNSMLEKYRLAC